MIPLHKFQSKSSYLKSEKSKEQLREQKEPQTLHELMKSRSKCRGFRDQYFFPAKNANQQKLTELNRQERSELMIKELLFVAKYFMSTGPIAVSYVIGELSHFLRVYVMEWSKTLTHAAHWMGLKRTTFTEQLRSTGMYKVRNDVLGSKLTDWEKHVATQSHTARQEGVSYEESYRDQGPQVNVYDQLCEKHKERSPQEYRLEPDSSKQWGSESSSSSSYTESLEVDES